MTLGEDVIAGAVPALIKFEQRNFVAHVWMLLNERVEGITCCVERVVSAQDARVIHIKQRVCHKRRNPFFARSHYRPIQTLLAEQDRLANPRPCNDTLTLASFSPNTSQSPAQDAPLRLFSDIDASSTLLEHAPQM